MARRTRGSILRRGRIYYIKYSLAGRARMERAGRSLSDAQRLLTERLAELDQGMYRLDRVVSFDAFMDRFWTDHVECSGLKPSTKSAYASVLRRHLCVTDAQALQACRFDQAAGRITNRILEHASGTRHGQRLRVLPIMEIVFDNPGNVRAYASAQLEPDPYDKACRQMGAAVSKTDRCSGQILEITLRRNNSHRLDGVLHFAQPCTRIHDEASSDRSRNACSPFQAGH